MTSQFKFRRLPNLAKLARSRGFTLIELLIVILIIGVLMAIALPNLLGQVAKGRQAEAKSNLGTINRAQEAYRFETGTFGTVGNTSSGTFGTLPLKISGEYYNYEDDNSGGPGDFSSTEARHKATAIPLYGDDIKDYTSSVGQTPSGAFNQIVCEANDPTITINSSANGTACDSTTSSEVN
jgi:prepilin-type N-terminal cleavage/methylation domain-containing protein